VAIKILAAKYVGDEGAHRRFFREMALLGRLNHPNIVQPFDAGDAGGVLYLTMELVDGPDIESLARKFKQIRIADACEIVRQAALGMQHAHENGLVHRDLKPSNLLLSSTGVKIADLGMALLRNPEPELERLTESLMIMGTGDYMAPEQKDGAHHVDIRADIYSLGCTLFRLIAGKAPYASLGGASMMGKLIAHIHEPLPDISTHRPEITMALKAVLNKTLAKQRDDRFSEPRQLADALAPFCEGATLLQMLESTGTSESENGLADTKPGAAAGESRVEVTLPISPAAEVHWIRRIRTRIVAVLFLLCLAAVAVFLMTNGARGNRADSVLGSNQGDSSNQTTDNSKDGDKKVKLVSGQDFVGHLPLNAESKVEPQPGTIARRWYDEFGLVPTEATWIGQSGLGSWAVDEGLRALTIQTVKTIRLVKLGSLTESHLKHVHLECDIEFRSKTGTAGFFLGFQKDTSDTPRHTQFQGIGIELYHELVAAQLGTETETERSVMATRRLTEILLATRNASGGGRRRDCDVQIKKDIDKWRLKMTIKDGAVTLISLAGVDCPYLCEDNFNREYQIDNYLGDFGVFSYETNVWFSNPKFERSQK
jgi:serine/threonine protein kinase